VRGKKEDTETHCGKCAIDNDRDSSESTISQGTHPQLFCIYLNMETRSKEWTIHIRPLEGT
jgi:hypothetical protein